MSSRGIDGDLSLTRHISHRRSLVGKISFECRKIKFHSVKLTTSKKLFAPGKREISRKVCASGNFPNLVARPLFEALISLFFSRLFAPGYKM